MKEKKGKNSNLPNTNDLKDNVHISTLDKFLFICEVSVKFDFKCSHHKKLSSPFK